MSPWTVRETSQWHRWEWNHALAEDTASNSWGFGLFVINFFGVTCVCFLMPWALQGKDCHFVWHVPMASRLWWDTGGITRWLGGGSWVLLQHHNLLSDWACVLINQQVLPKDRYGCYSHRQQQSWFPLFCRYWDKTKPGLSFLPVCINLDLLLNPPPGTNIIFTVLQNYSPLAAVDAVYDPSIWI